MDRTTADPLVGRTVAQYEVVARLGGGGMGVVYAARDTKLGRRVALKFLPPQWSHDESAKQRFIREAQAASATDHPNICTVHDIATADDGQLFIVMAHYEGETLKQRLERGPLPVDEAIEIAAQVAEGLAKAHAQGVVHRDIKPGNLMLTEDGVKILDFGLAKLADARLKLTLEGSTIGTISYMSPEQVRGEDADARSDVWAVGVVLYEMLAGDVPFKGGYPEAISHAIKSDPPAPLRPGRPEVSEALEQVVFRALLKDPNVRFQTARDLARPLRALQGRSLPLDLRTLPLPPIEPARMKVRRRWWRTRMGLAATAALMAVLIGAPIWVFSPVERVLVAVAPVGNQTGYAELDPYRLGLTQELIAQLSGSRHMRVFPYERLVQILRRFRLEGRDISSRDVLQAVAAQSGARAIVVPTLLYENGAWRARVEIRNAEALVQETAAYDTPPVVSSLMKDAVYSFMAELGVRIQEHFIATGPRRAYLAESVRSLLGNAAPPAPTSGSLDAAAAFERGTDAYERQEYFVAFQAFTAAVAGDPRNPRLHAWQSRAARLSRRDSEAADAAEQAAGLMTDRLSRRDRLFIDAIVAEARQDRQAAEARHRELVAAFPDEAGWLMELAAFQDRGAATADATETAITTYLEALRLDDRLPRAHLELCRLYGPARQNERVRARDHGQRSLDTSRSIGDRNGEALALICLTEVLRFGSQEDRLQARQNAELARTILTDIGSTYNLPRAEMNAALGAAAQGNIPAAAGLFAQALESARRGGNRVLEPLLLMNLGVAQVRLGNRAEAAKHYQASAELYEALGDEQRAAQQQANSAAVRIEYGDQPAEALRDVQNALAVFRKLGDKNFEAFCLQVIAAYYRQVGRHADAERELNRALAILRERNLEDDIASVTIDRARSQIDTGNYAGALTTLTDVTAQTAGPTTAAARMHLARVHLRLGDLPEADGELTQASSMLDPGDDLFPLLLLTRGELAYEAGHLADARTAFARAASLWTASLPDIASVEARAYVGLIDALGGRPAEGRAQVQSSLEQAERMERLPLVARCRMFLTQIQLRERRATDALRALADVSPDDAAGQTIGPELRAQVHYWRSIALAAGGDATAAEVEALEARKILEALRASLPEANRAGFAARRDITRIIG